MGDEGKEKLPVSVDVGLKASLEIKGEVPQESMGRFLDAVVDVFRPFTEARGLKADQIRLQREDVLLKIAMMARERATTEHITLNPVPNKLLVPFIEKASLEDLDEEMQKRWAALLLSSSKEYHARHLTFVDILSRLSSDELKILEEVCFACKVFPETYYPGGHLDQNRRTIETNASMLVTGLSPKIGEVELVFESFQQAASMMYGAIMHGSVRQANSGINMCYTQYGHRGLPKFRSLEILQRERLVEFEVWKPDQSTMQPPPGNMQVGYFNIAFLGIDFVNDCSPRASEIAARRRHPIPGN